MKRKRSLSPPARSPRPSRSPRGARASTRSPKSPSNRASDDSKTNLDDSANSSRRTLRTKRIDYTEAIEVPLNFAFELYFLVVAFLLTLCRHYMTSEIRHPNVCTFSNNSIRFNQSFQPLIFLYNSFQGINFMTDNIMKGIDLLYFSLIVKFGCRKQKVHPI